MRKIPSTMATQHPDHAGKPYWHSQEFISVSDENKELFLNFSELGIDEYKWDWEGKLVDESVMERLLSQYYEYFQKYPLGKEKFLTFRLPNPKAETEFRLARAFVNLLSASAMTQKVGLHTPPLFEVILPMTESAEEMIAIQEAFREIADLKHELLRVDGGTLNNIEIIPLFEQVDTIIHSDQILKKYLDLYKKTFKALPIYLRPYVARSDPALNSGMIPSVLGIKIAFSKYKQLEEKTGIKMFPVIGAAALPFRGGISPDTVKSFANEYKGVRTAIIQSAFRYDYPLEDVKKAIKILNKTLPQGEPQEISEKEEQELVSLIPYFELAYKRTVEELAPVINKIAHGLPKRRERVQHIGLFGYSRGVGKVTLPRAIGFTAALYSIGIPPELLGSGYGLKKAIEEKKIKTIEKFYLNLKADLIRSGRYLNKKNLQKLAKKYPVLLELQKEVQDIETYLGKKLEPVTPEEKEHQELTTKILANYEKGKPFEKFLVKAAVLRRSLG